MARRRSDNTGSVFKDKYGYWNAQVQNGFTKAGRPRYTRKRAKSEAEVVAWLNRALARTPSEAPPDKLTVAEWLDRWLEQRRIGWSYTTHTGYVQLCADHLKPALGPYALQKLRQSHVQGLVNRLAGQAKPPARNTIRNIVACLRKALADAVTTKYVSSNVAEVIDLPKATRRRSIHKTFTPEQAQAFLAAVESDRWKALYWTALLIGLRQGELLALRWEDLDLENSTLRVSATLQRHKGKGLVRAATKTETSEALVPLPPLLVTVLREHRALQDEERQYARWREQGYVFTTKLGTPISARNLFRSFVRVLEHAKLPRIRFHDLRHSCATLLVKLGVHPRIIMEILRHAQISTTMNIYADVVPDTNRAAVNQLSELLAPALLEMPERVRKA
jgi:integrase